MSETALVHVVDDDEAMRNSLVFLLGSASLEAVAYDSAESFLATLPALDFACIITDVSMPGMTGIDLLRRLRQDSRRLPVIVITGQSDLVLAIEALKAGAFDFIEKPFKDERIIAAVRSALELRTNASLKQEDQATILARFGSLTGREKQVLDNLIEGHANQTIARDLDISPRTVEACRANVMTKLNASSLSELVRMAFIARASLGT